MGKVFNVQDRQSVFEYILTIATECGKIVSLVQVGSGANGYHDEHSDLDFVIALDSGESMHEVMDYMHRMISAKYELAFSRRMNPGIYRITSCPISWKLTLVTAHMNTRQR